MSADRDHLRALLEAAIYVSPEPVPLKHLARATGQTPELVEELLQSLMAEYDRADHGVRLRFVAGGYGIGTKPALGAELKHVVDGLRPPKPLSKQAVETALVVALLQPVTAHEIQAARKVRNTDAIRTLLRRKLIGPAGRALGRGKALQYRTTPQFLVEFGLKDLSELPNRILSAGSGDQDRHRSRRSLTLAAGRTDTCVGRKKVCALRSAMRILLSPPASPVYDILLISLKHPNNINTKST
jgi:segregation and condensation protein B